MYWIIVIISLILISISYKVGQSSCEIAQLTGFWESPTEFNKESDIKTCTFYIGEKNSDGYAAYVLLIDDDDEIIINEPCNFKISSNSFNIFQTTDYHEYNMKLTNFESDMWPKNMIMRYYPYTNKIILNDDKKIYMVLYKNPVLTELEQAKKNKQETVDKPPDNQVTDVVEQL